MEYRRLGRTGLNVSILSLGSGGPNRFGQSLLGPGKSINRLVRQAIELGINFFDTASTYGRSESLLCAALQGVPRDRYFVCTKVLPVRRGTIISAAEASQQVERSLQRLGVEELDILQLHRVTPESYEEARDRLMPELEKLRIAGKVRYLGISEYSSRDPHHSMLKRALQDDLFDTIMVAYSLLNSSAEQFVLPLALSNDVGVIGMTPARHLVTRSTWKRLELFARELAGVVASPPGSDKLKLRLQVALATLRRTGVRQVVPITRECGLEPLVLPAAAYTFAASHSGIATVLTGTIDPAHLQQNLAAALASALTTEESGQLRMLFD